jgi:predicted RNA-binding protein with PUA-like domain
MTKYWLMKSEPKELSIDDLKQLPNQTIEWFGVRNYLARNFMYEQMEVGDLAFFWHSGIKVPGISGIVEINCKAHPDSTQFNSNSKYYDNSSKVTNPRWWCVDVKLVEKTIFVPITALRLTPSLHNMQVLQKGNRLSVSPVTYEEWEIILALMKKGA